MVTMTWGQIPTKEKFDEAFAKKCPDGKFTVRNDPLHGNCDFTASELFRAVEEAVENDRYADDDSWDNFANAVLYSLGFEWV